MKNVDTVCFLCNKIRIQLSSLLLPYINTLVCRVSSYREGLFFLGIIFHKKMSQPALLSPIKIGDHTLDHRVVLAPLTRLRNTEEGVPQDHCVVYYEQRATKNGLLISEATVISPVTDGYKFAPGIYTDKQIEGWKKVVDAVHAKGGVIFLQLWHLGRTVSSKNLPAGNYPVSCSAIAISGTSAFGTEYEVPHALTVDEIQDTIQDYCTAAKNAFRAGFDGKNISKLLNYGSYERNF